MDFHSNHGPDGRQRATANALALLAAAVAVLGCAGRTPPARSLTPTCAAGDTALVRETLYFGRNRPAGGTVSDAEWQTFLNQVLTPRFPAGLTVITATGQWRGRSGDVEQERSYVVTVFHAGDDTSLRAIEEVALEYKQRFGQEAVLRERASTCAAFE